MRSAHLGIITMTLSALALIGVMASVVLRLWLPAVILGAFSISAIVVATVLIRRAEPDELQALAAANERWTDAWARGMGKASGGWEPLRRRRKE